MYKSLKVSRSGQNWLMGIVGILFLTFLACLIIVGVLININSITGIVLSFGVIALYIYLLIYLISNFPVYYYDSEGFFKKGSKSKNLYKNTCLTIYVRAQYSNKGLDEVKKHAQHVVKFCKVEVRGGSDNSEHFLDTGNYKYGKMIALLLSKVPQQNIDVIGFSSFSRGEAGGLSIYLTNGEREYIRA